MAVTRENGGGGLSDSAEPGVVSAGDWPVFAANPTTASEAAYKSKRLSFRRSIRVIIYSGWHARAGPAAGLLSSPTAGPGAGSRLSVTGTPGPAVIVRVTVVARTAGGQPRLGPVPVAAPQG